MSPTLELQGAIVAALKGAAPLAALVGAKIYDPVPDKAQMPYVSISAADELQDDAECIDGVEITQLIDAYSNKQTRSEVANIAAAIKGALHRANLTLNTNALVEIRHRQTRFQLDPDGKTQHAIVEITATVQET